MSEEETQTPLRELSHSFGAVMLKEWMQNPSTGGQVLSVVGPIKLLTAKEHFGFQPKGNEANWGILIGSENEQQVFILGCQIRGILWGKKFSVPGISVNTWVLV